MMVCRWSIVFGLFLSSFVLVEAFGLMTQTFVAKKNPTRTGTALIVGSKLFTARQQEDTGTSNEQRSSSTDDRRVARRWNGNYKHATTKLCEVPKAKKLQLQLSVRHKNNNNNANANVTTKTIEKKRQETLQHVLTKAMLWKLYCDEYPNIEIEQDIGDPNYLPDVISLDVSDDNNDGITPLFWGESGRMKVHKAMDLMQRYPNTHIVHCRWDMGIDAIAGPLLEHLQELLDTDRLDDQLSHRRGRFSFCSLPLDVWRFVDEETGMIQITHDDLDWRELEFPTTKSPTNTATVNSKSKGWKKDGRIK
jgi:hypothetical protein